MKAIAMPSWSVCPRCEQPMKPGTSCDASAWHIDGKHVEPIRYGAETPEYVGEFCRDCGVGRGATHHYGCSVERCPHMRQAVTCDLCEPLEEDPYYEKLRRLS